MHAEAGDKARGMGNDRQRGRTGSSSRPAQGDKDLLGHNGRTPAKMKTKGSAVIGVERMAFMELMVAGAAAQQDRKRVKKQSECVGDQAVELDKDDMLGFGGIHKKGGKDDGNEDGHDTDGVVGALVDDGHMDEAALTKAKVLKEHL